MLVLLLVAENVVDADLRRRGQYTNTRVLFGYFFQDR
jgi:hypothetical protein